MNAYITDVRKSARQEKERELGPGLKVREVIALTGATEHQLRYWHYIGLVWPSIQEPSASGVPRLYSAEDVKTIKAIVSWKKAGMSLQKIRRPL